MAPKTSKKSATPMTQSILGFSSTKRTASAANLAKKSGVKPTASVLSDARKVSTGSEFDDISLTSNSTLSEDDPIEDSFDASDRKTERKVDTEERTQTVSKRLAATKLSQEAELKKERTRAVKPEPTKAVVPEELPELNPQDTKWRKPFAQAKAKMGNLQTSMLSSVVISTLTNQCRLSQVHAQNQTKIHDILRVFDKYVNIVCWLLSSALIMLVLKAPMNMDLVLGCLALIDGNERKLWG